MTIQDKDPSGPLYPSREYNRETRNHYIHTLLNQLSELEAANNPVVHAQATNKDLNAFKALSIAGDLVREVAGWALDHTIGLSVNGLNFVPLQPDGTRQHPEYLSDKAAVDTHQHEEDGAVAREDIINLNNLTLRAILQNLLVANSGGFPDFLANKAVISLKALEFGEALPLLKPRDINLKARYAELQLQARALQFVEYRRKMGLRKSVAQELVANMYCVAPSTLKTWEVRLRKNLGNLEIERQLAFARNIGENVASRLRHSLTKNARSEADKRFDQLIRQSGEREFGDEALAAAAQEYRLRAVSEAEVYDANSGVRERPL